MPRSKAPGRSSERDDEPSVGVSAWALSVLLALYYALSLIDRTILVHLVDLIKADLKLSDFQISLVLGPVFGVSYAVFGIPFGWATDRFDRRWVLFAGVFTWSAATMLSGFANSFETLVAARMGVAFGEAALMPAAYSMLSDRFPPHRVTSAIAVFNMGPKLGQSLAFVCAGLAILLGTQVSGGKVAFFSDLAAWQLVMLTIGAPGVILSFLLFALPEPARQTKADAVVDIHGPSFIAFLRARWRVVVPLFLGFCAAGIAGNALIAWVPAFMGRTYGWTAVQYGPWLGAVSLIAAAVLLPKGAVVDWFYARGMRDAALRVYTWLLIAFTPLAVVIFFAPTPQLFIVGYGLVYGMGLPFMIFAAAAIQMVTPNRFRGQMIGLFQMVMPIFGASLGPTLTAGLTDFVFHDPKKLGLALAIVTPAAMFLSVLLLRHVLKVMKRADVSDEPIPGVPAVAAASA